MLRRIAEEGTPPVTVRLVNWADEEGARFGRSLFGSSAAAGSMRDQDELRQLTDRDGISLPDALAANGVDLDRALEARAQLESAAAYLELHIEQGPVLEDDGHPARRRARHLRRRALADHLDGAGGACRLDADGQAPRRARRRGEARARDPRDRGAGRERRRLHVGRRRLPAGDRDVGRRDRRAAARPAPSRRGRAWPSSSARRREASERFAAEENIDVSWERIWSIEPILFDLALIHLCDEACREVAGVSHRLPSGPLHDAAEVARAGVPTVMMFVQSLRGLSHTKLEDTRAEHLELAVAALDRLADKHDRPGLRSVAPATIAAGLVLGAGVTWNISNVGAVAGVMSDELRRLARGRRPAHDRALRHAPGGADPGRAADRPGRAPRVGLAALAVVAAGNAIALLDPSLGLGLAGRVVMGVGTGAGFVAGIDLVRSGKGGPFWQGPTAAPRWRPGASR